MRNIHTRNTKYNLRWGSYRSGGDVFRVLYYSQFVSNIFVTYSFRVSPEKLKNRKKKIKCFIQRRINILFSVESLGMLLRVGSIHYSQFVSKHSQQCVESCTGELIICVWEKREKNILRSNTPKKYIQTTNQPKNILGKNLTSPGKILQRQKYLHTKMFELFDNKTRV